MNDKRPTVRRNFVIACVLIGVPLFLAAVDLGRLLNMWSRFRGPRVRPDNFLLVTLWELPGGWLAFLERIIPSVDIQPAAIGFGIFAMVLAWVLLHTIGRRLCKAWTWRSTFGGIVLPAILFSIVLGSGGVWSRFRELREDPHPIQIRSWFFYYESDSSELEKVFPVPPR